MPVLKEKQPSERQAEVEQPVELPGESNTGEKLKAELDDLLDEIDGVLESEAQEFLDAFVQRGGE